VSKLVAHEVEVALTTARHGDQADHLVQGNSAVNDGAAGAVTYRQKETEEPRGGGGGALVHS
jgi:hypothetical protein